MDTEVIVACRDQFSLQLTQRTYVFVDNAPMPRAHAFIKEIPKWVNRGLIINLTSSSNLYTRNPVSPLGGPGHYPKEFRGSHFAAPAVCSRLSPGWHCLV